MEKDYNTVKHAKPTMNTMNQEQSTNAEPTLPPIDNDTKWWLSIMLATMEEVGIISIDVNAESMDNAIPFFADFARRKLPQYRTAYENLHNKRKNQQ
jgi:hypothetical protein